VVLTYRINNDVGLLKLEQWPTVSITVGICQTIEPTGKVSLSANERAVVRYIHTKYKKQQKTRLRTRHVPTIVALMDWMK
jgi:hypothetical protein